MKTKYFKSLMLVFAMCTFAVLGGVLLTACGHQHSWTYELVEEGGHEHYRICKGCGEKVIEECSLEEVIYDATCDAPKTTVHTCTVCKSSHQHYDGTERGHDWGDLTPLYRDDDTTDDNPGEYLKEHAKFCKHDNTHEEEHEACQFGEPEVVAPTCSTVGFTKHTCIKCKGFYITDEKPALGHDWKENGKWFQGTNEQEEHIHYRECTRQDCDLEENKLVELCADDGADMVWQSTVDATCTDASTETYKCNKCEREVETHQVAALGHSYNEFQYIGQDNTHKHNKICTRPRADGEKCGHIEEELCDFLDVTKEPTCQEQGYTSHTCRVCSHYYEDDTKEMLDHLWSAFYKVADGSHERKCTRGEVHYESHQADYHTDTTPEDCENAEHTKLTCQFAGCNYEEEFDGKPATGHVEGIWTYCGDDSHHEHQKTCTVCGKVLKKADCKFTDVVTKETCETDGYTTHTCQDCSKTYTDSQVIRTGHAWGEWQQDGDKHYRICQHDNTHRQEHTIEKSESRELPTCTDEGKLTVTCLHEENGQRCTIKIETPIEPLGHQWNIGDDTVIINEHEGHENAKCLRLNCEATHTGAHTYTKNNFCDICGWDGLVYKANSDGTASVASDRNVENVKEIIISDKTPMWNTTDKPLTEKQVLGGMNIVGIGTSSFMWNPNVEKIVLGKNITEITHGAAHGCKKLKILVLNEGLKTIKSDSFQDCTLLDTILVMKDNGEIDGEKIVPSTITYISSSAFKGTAFEKNLANWAEVTYTRQDSDPEVVGKGLILGDQLVNVLLDEGKDTFEVPDTVTCIAENTFSGMKNLVTIVLPGTITTIGENAFYGCENLEHSIFNGGVDAWLAISFGNDYSSPTHYAKTFTIRDVSPNLVVGDDVSTIPAGCFYGDALTSVVIGENVTSIGAGAFENCASLESVTIKSTKLKYIGEDAFKGTKFYETAERDEYGALYIGNYLIDVKTDAEGIDTPIQSDEEGPVKTQKVFKVKEGTTLIACGAFRGCEKLQHIEIATTVSRIGTEAFVGCTSLKTIKILDTEHSWMIWTQTIGRVESVSDSAWLASHAGSHYTGEWYWYAV